MIASRSCLVGVALAASFLASATALAQTEQFTYDDLGRLVTVDHGDGKTTSYTLDPAGNRKNVQTSDGAPPTTPTNLDAVAVAPTQINLTWSASTDNVGVTEYRVERCQGAGCATFSQIANPAGTSFSDMTVTDITSYSYRVRAADGVGNLSGYSTPDSATTPDGTAPSAPTNLSATAASGTQINLSWTAATDNVGVTGYFVERCAGASCSNFAQIATPATASYADTPVSDITTYRYRVRARDAVNNIGAYSSIASATTPDGTAPSVPANLSATAVAYNQINLSWSASTDNVGVTGYRVERCSGSGCSNFSQIATPASTSYSDTTLSGSTSYSYRVRANDAVPNLSGYSSTASATTPAGAPIAPTISPGGVLLKAAGESYIISWSPGVSGATSYELYENDALVWSGTATSRSYTKWVAGEYSYQAKACNASGCSGFSNTKFVQVCDPSCN